MDANLAENVLGNEEEVPGWARTVLNFLVQEMRSAGSVAVDAENVAKEATKEAREANNEAMNAKVAVGALEVEVALRIYYSFVSRI